MSDQTPFRAPTTRDTSALTPASDNSLTWSDIRPLGFTSIGDVHEEFHTLALKLVICSDASVADAIKRFKQHTISHFEQEDRWIHSTDPPPWDYHLAEHAAVLKSVGDIEQAVVLGEADADMIRSLGMALFG